MTYTLKQIEERVFALLDENQEIQDERIYFADPCVSVASLIDMLVEETAREVLATCDISLIDECEHYPPFSVTSALNRVPAIGGITEMMCTVKRNALTGKTRIQLPDDFLRLLHFRMSDWDDGVSTPLVYGGDECRLRMGARIGRRSHRHRPAVAIDLRGEKKYLEIFGSADGATVAELDFLTIPRLSGDTIRLPTGTFGAVCEAINQRLRNILKINYETYKE